MKDATTSLHLSKNVIALDAWDNASPETIKKCFVKCGFGAKEVIELPPPDDEMLQLMDDSEWIVFVQFVRNIETAHILNVKVICSDSARVPELFQEN